MNADLIETIKKARGKPLSVALKQATTAVTATNARELVEAAGETLTQGHSDLTHSAALAAFFLEAVRSVREPFHLQHEVSCALVATATSSLPAALRMLEAMNAAVVADSKLAQKFGLRDWRSWLFEYTMHEKPPVLRSAQGVSTADVVFAAVELALSCAVRGKVWDQWRFAMERVTEAPSRRGLPPRVKGFSRKAIGFTYRLGIEQTLVLLKAGLTCADPETARVIVGDAVGELEKCAPDSKLLVQAVHDVKLSRPEVLALAAFLTEHPPTGKSIGTAALTWAKDTSDRKCAAALLKTLGAEVASAKVAPSGKKVLVALGKRRFDEARTLLEKGARMDEPGCDPDGAIHLLRKNGADDSVRFSLIELMLKNGLSIDDIGVHGDTPLHAAAVSGDHSLALFLIGHDADLDAVDVQSSTGHSETPLHAAAENGDAKMVRLLLDHGADPGIKNWNDELPLEVADDKVKALLRGAKKPRPK